MELTLGMYESYGNDYLVYDCVKNEYELKPEDVRNICNRRFGAGADRNPGRTGTDVWKNGCENLQSGRKRGSNQWKRTRIFAKYLKDAGYVIKKELVLQTKAGRSQYTITMSRREKSRSRWDTCTADRQSHQGKAAERANLCQWSTTAENTWEPVCGWEICTVSCRWRKSQSMQYVRSGKNWENSGRFPDGVNTQIIKITDKNNIDTEGYERGAGYTLASGSSCCAAAGVAYQMGLIDPCVYVHMAGGTMKVRIDEKMNAFMTGTAESIGNITLSDEFLRKYQIMAEKK